LQKAVAHVTDGFPFDLAFYSYGLDYEYSLMPRPKRIRAVHEGYRHHAEEHDRNVKRLLFLQIVMAHNYVLILFPTVFPSVAPHC
jgi:hypothetical protein